LHLLGIGELAILGDGADLREGFQDPVVKKPNEYFERLVALLAPHVTLVLVLAKCAVVEGLQAQLFKHTLRTEYRTRSSEQPALSIKRIQRVVQIGRLPGNSHERHSNGHAKRLRKGRPHLARKGGSNGSPLPPDRVGHFAASANVCLTKCSVTSSCCQQRPRERVFQRLLAGT
jgi:hypothetical protein